MIDREKVIKGLECCKSVEEYCVNCPYNEEVCTTTLSADALALLKEQTEIVRCKDCAKQCTDNCLLYWNDINTPDNWYCADGVKRDERT